MDELLQDVMMDAEEKMEGEEVSELLFFTILKLMEYVEHYGKEGLLSNEEILNDEALTKELKGVFAIPIGSDLLSHGLEEDRLSEILVTKYWASNPQGIYAMANFMAICTWIALKEGRHSYRDIEPILISYLSAEDEERYKAYRDINFPQFRDKTPKDKVMKLEANFYDGIGEKTYLWIDEGYIVTVRDKLENMIMDTPVDILKQMMETVFDKHRLSITIRRFSYEVKEKLFSCMSEEEAEEICNNVLHMDDIRFRDLMDALTSMLLDMFE